MRAAEAPRAARAASGAKPGDGGRPRRLTILGSTGSVGEQALAVAEAFPERYPIAALAAGRNVEKLAQQVQRFRPELVSVADAALAGALRERLGSQRVEIAVGAAGLEAVAAHPSDLVLSALVGAVGLAPTLAAIRAGRDVALANKEVLVMAGALVMREVRAHGVTLLPVDSEHSAIFQVLAGQRREDVSRLILTASGGPFRTWDAARIARATLAEALRHPNWEMGPKITIDSATLMNKGLEVIEARWLFDVPPERDRRRRASAIDRALARRVRGRLGARAAGAAGHARADRRGARAPRAPPARSPAPRPRRAGAARVRGSGSQALPRVSTSPTRRCAAPKPRPRC